VSPKRDPDVAIGASVKAKRLRFRSKPHADVEPHGEMRERENLPEEVQPGVTYRDVSVRWAAAARLEDPQPERQKGPRP
jgi:hypothetical protein